MVQFKQHERKCLKCYLFISPYQLFSINVRRFIIKTSSCNKFLGISIYSNYSFEWYIKRICEKASQNRYALSRIGKYAIQIIINFAIQLLSISLDVPW